MKIAIVGEAAVFKFEKYDTNEWSGRVRSIPKVFEISTNDAEEQKSNLKNRLPRDSTGKNSSVILVLHCICSLNTADAL